MNTIIPLIDLAAQYQTIKSEIDAAIIRVLESGQFVLGPEVQTFEKEVADFIGVKYGIGVASGTDALILSLRAINIKPGDEIIVPAYTFFATVSAVLSVGAKPVFVDIDADSYCIDPQLIPEKITEQTKAIIPVHLYGHPADMASILEVGRMYDLKIIEDNAQAFGAEYNGEKTGSFGDTACLSFFPSKNMGGYGDGGMVVTGIDELASRLKMLRTHGWNKKYFPEYLGYNSRLDELQAAVLRVKLRYVFKWNSMRRQLAKRYNRSLNKLALRIPIENSQSCHVYHLYVIQSKDRDKIRDQLFEAGIATGIYYPQPPYLAKPCRFLGHISGDFPNADQASQETLAIPLFPEMTTTQLNKVVSVLSRALSI